MGSYNWRTLYFSKGGPIFIGDISQFMNWRGGEVLGNSWIIHYYGRLVPDLPGSFLSHGPDVWHQYKNFASLKKAGTFVKELIAAAKELALEAKILSSPDNLDDPDCRITGPVSFTMKQKDSNVFVLTLSKGTDYTMISRRVRSEHKIMFNENSTALFFPMESNGYVHIGITDDCSSIIIMQCWTSRENLISDIKAITEKILPSGDEDTIDYKDEILLIVNSFYTHKTLFKDNFSGNGLIEAIVALIKQESVIDLISGGKDKTGFGVKITPGSYSYHFFCKEHHASLEDESYSYICLKIDKVQSNHKIS